MAANSKSLGLFGPYNSRNEPAVIDINSSYAILGVSPSILRGPQTVPHRGCPLFDTFALPNATISIKRKYRMAVRKLAVIQYKI